MRAHWITGAALALLVGCGGTSYQMTGVGPATGADAHLAIEETGAGNRQLQLQVSHLPPPSGWVRSTTPTTCGWLRRAAPRPWSGGSTTTEAAARAA